MFAVREFGPGLEGAAMTPYYQDDWVTIYHGDCRDILPIEADLCLTDPPYGIGESNEKNLERISRWQPTDYGHYSWDSERQVAGVQLTMKSADHVIIWGGNYYTDILPPSSSWLVWDKRNGDNDFADCELAWTSHKKAVRLFSWRWAGFRQEKGGRDREYRTHPTQKPLPLFKWCVENYSEIGDIMLDPFMGSGTTLRAAKDLNRKAIGIELEEKYCEIAAERMRQEVLDFT